MFFLVWRVWLGFSFKTEKKKKKEKDTWQNKRFCDTFFFACGALKQGGTSKLVFEIKGKGKKKSQRAKIFGKENKRRTKNERGSVWSDA